MTAHLLLALMLGAQTDQTIQVKKGARLEVHSLAGDVDVKVWNRDEVRVEAEHSDRDTVEVRPGDLAVVVRGRSRGGAGRAIDYKITVPAWMAVSVSGQSADVFLDGVGGNVTVETNRGDIRIQGGSGFISAKSVQGQITIERARGRIEAQTVNDGIRLADVSGDVTAGTTNGDIELERVDTANLDAYTVNGAIAYDGPLKDKGSYRLTTHNGRVSLVVPETASATMMVRTYGGEFRSSFPVTLSSNQERRNRFTLTFGDGGARVELESFNGSISLRRPGEPRPQSQRSRDRQRPRIRIAPNPDPDASAKPKDKDQR